MPNNSIQLVTIPCASPKCEKTLVFPSTMSVKDAVDAADWSTIITLGDTLFACNNDHALEWLMANDNRFAQPQGE